MGTRATILFLLAAGALMAGQPSASKLFSAGRKAEKAGRITEAYVLYSEAAALDPSEQKYWLHSMAVRPRAEAEKAEADKKAEAEMKASAAKRATEKNGQTGDELAGEGESGGTADLNDRPEGPSLSAGRQENPLPPLAKLALGDMADKPLPPSRMDAHVGLKDFHLRGDGSKLFTDVAHAFGLECVFDKDYQPGRTIRFDVDGVDYRTALRGLELATGSFIVPLSAQRFLVASDTPQKRAELERFSATQIRLPEAASAQEFNDIVNAVRQAMALEHGAVDTATNTVIFRDRVSRLLPARDLFQNFMRPRAEVAIEVEVLDVSRNDAVTYGVDLQTQIPLFALTMWANNKPSIPQIINGLVTFGGGKTFMGLGVINPSLVARMSQSSGRLLIHSSLRSTDGMPATLHAGDRFPVLTGGYFGPANFNSGGTAYTPPPSFNYEDLGLSLKVTPKVHGSEETTLNIEAEFKALSGAGLNGIPIIVNRALKSETRIRFGEWAVLSGILNTEQARSISGLAGLSKVPVLGPLVSTHNKTDETRQVLILVRPHLLAPPPSVNPAWSLFLGSDAKPVRPL